MGTTSMKNLFLGRDFENMQHNYMYTHNMHLCWENDPASVHFHLRFPVNITMSPLSHGKWHT